MYADLRRYILVNAVGGCHVLLRPRHCPHFRTRLLLLSHLSIIYHCNDEDADDDDDDNDDHLIVQEGWEGGQGDELTVAGHWSEQPLVRHQTALISSMIIMVMMILAVMVIG